jgi:glutamate-1-semialdehyde 2,1-aminomutase
MNFKKSNDLIQVARILTPLGAQTYSKSYRYYVAGNAPLFIDRGKGSKVWDIDGNKYIDFVLALGPVTVGYNNKKVNDAIKRQLKKGISFSLATEIEVQLAKKLTQIMPGVEMVRFLKNGADATFAAVKLARAYTGKEVILTSGYHGMHDWSISVTENNAGVPKNIETNTKAFSYNNKDQVLELFQTYKNKIAAVILEPIQDDGPEDAFLEFLRDITKENDSLLIYDEVVSGFRYALGGASEYYNVVPDLIAFGKGMANGMPLSVIGGKKEVLELIESKKVFISTTFGGETLSMAAAMETINQLSRPNSFQYLWELGSVIKTGLTRVIDELSLHGFVKVIGLDPHCGPVFTSNDVKIDKYDLASIFNYYMIQNGVLTVGIINLSLSHTIADVNHYLKASALGLKKIRQFVDGQYLIDFPGRVNPVFKR